MTFPSALPAASGNPYWDAVRAEAWETDDGGSRPYAAYWPQMCRRYSWAIPSPQALDWITAVLRGRPVLDAGAGKGYWAWQLQRAGMDVMPCDHVLTAGAFAPVCQCDAAQAARVHWQRVLMLCWPPCESPMAAETLRCYRGDLLLYIGEGRGGNAADEDFFDILDDEWRLVAECADHISWYVAHDNLALYRRGGTQVTAGTTLGRE